MRLLFLSDHLGYTGGIVHGATTYFLNVLPSLKRAGVDVHACFLRSRHPAAEKLEADGIRPIFLNRNKWDPRALSDLVRLIREHDIQIVHAAGMKGILLGRIAARSHNCKMIIHLHDTSVPGRVFRMMHRAMAGWTDMCITVSDAVGELATSEFGLDADRVMTLHNGIALEATANPSPDTRSRIRQELALPDDALVIGVIGRLSPEKGHDVLIRAMPELLQTHPTARLLIVGDGPMRSNYERIAGELNLEASVCFAGYRTDVLNVLTAIDVLAVPSYREGLSYSAIEGMAAGRPVVAFAVGGIPEVISHNHTGLLVSPDDSLGFITAVRRLLNDPSLVNRLVKNAQHSVNRFSIDTHIDRLMTTYSRLLGCVEMPTHTGAHAQSNVLSSITKTIRP